MACYVLVVATTVYKCRLCIVLITIYYRRISAIYDCT